MCSREAAGQLPAARLSSVREAHLAAVDPVQSELSAAVTPCRPCWWCCRSSELLRASGLCQLDAGPLRGPVSSLSAAYVLPTAAHALVAQHVCDARTQRSCSSLVLADTRVMARCTCVTHAARLAQCGVCVSVCVCVQYSSRDTAAVQYTGLNINAGFRMGIRVYRQCRIKGSS